MERGSGACMRVQLIEYTIVYPNLFHGNGFPRINGNAFTGYAKHLDHYTGHQTFSCTCMTPCRKTLLVLMSINNLPRLFPPLLYITGNKFFYQRNPTCKALTITMGALVINFPNLGLQVERLLAFGLRHMGF